MIEKGCCVHFNGLIEKQCRAGIAYSNYPHRMNGLPCLRKYFSSGQFPDCAKFTEPTAEQIAEYEKQVAVAIEHMTKARQAIVEHTHGKRGVGGTIKCPNCEGGQLSFSVSGYNGHIHATCSTPHCTSWIE